MVKINKYTTDIVFIVLLFITTVYVWYPLTKFVLDTEGYEYLVYIVQNEFFSNLLLYLTDFNVQGIFFGYLFSHLFGIHLESYLWTEIFSIFLIGTSLYATIKIITKNSIIAFASSFLALVNFFGNGEMFLYFDYSTHFLERIIFNVDFLLISFLFLHLFLEKKKRKYYVISLSLFFISIFLSHFTTLFSAPLYIYPFVWHIKKPYRIEVLKGLILAIPYVLITLLFSFLQNTFSEHPLKWAASASQISIFTFLFHPQTYHYIDGILRQIAYMSQYPSVVGSIINGESVFHHVNIHEAYKLLVPILTSYTIAFIVIYKKLKKHRVLLFTLVLSVISILFLNLYLGRIDVFHGGGRENRYYYFPCLLLSVFWALFLFSVFKKRLFFPIILACLTFFLFLNQKMYHVLFLNLMEGNKPNQIIFNYILAREKEFQKETLIIVGPSQYFFPYEAVFLTEQLGKNKSIVFKTEDQRDFFDILHPIETAWSSSIRTNLKIVDFKPIIAKAKHVKTIHLNEVCSCIVEKTIK